MAKLYPYRTFSISLFLMCAHLCCFAQVDTLWTLKRDRDAVKVYTRSNPSFGLDEFKGVGMIEASVQKILSILQDPESMEYWVPDCKKAKLLSADSSQQYHYTVTNLPFPLADRDAIIHFQYLKIDSGYQVLMEGLPDYSPKIEDLVRIPYIKGFWILVPKGPNKTKVIYQIQADPGGAIPSWLANATAVSTPFNTILNLREFLNN